MTKKNNFAYNFFLVIKYFRFYFLCDNCNSTILKKSPTLKVEVLPSHPFLKIWLEAQPPPPLPCRKEKGVHTMCVGICMCDSMLLLKGLLYHQFMTTGKYFIIGMKINFLVKFSLLLVQKSGHLENTSFKSYWLNFNFRHVFYCMNFTPKKQNLLPLNKMPIQLKQG